MPSNELTKLLTTIVDDKPATPPKPPKPPRPPRPAPPLALRQLRPRRRG